MTNGTMLQGFEWYLPEDAGHWRRLAAQARAFADDGFTAVWLPPAYKGAGGARDVGYGVYDLYDLGEFDQKGSVPTKYGSKDDYLAAVRALQGAGLQVLADIVLNHRIGADGVERVRAVEVAGDNRNAAVGGVEEIEAYTRFNFPGRAGAYSGFNWNWRCFDGVDWDNLTRRTRIFRFDGKEWDGAVDGEDGNFDYLMGADLDFSNPDVVAELTRWGEWYLGLTGVDGVRLDAVKHINRDFYAGWLSAMRRAAGRELFAVGEYWSADLARLTGYLDGDGSCMSLFDVPLHQRLFEISRANGNFDLRRILDGTLVAARPVQAVTFVDNHDTQPGQALTSWVDGWFRLPAYAIILLRESGYPCVFYGDLFGIPHDGFGALAGLRELIAARRDRAYGAQRDWFDDPNLVGWTREGDDAHPGSGLAVLLSDGAGGVKRMCVGGRNAGRTFAPLAGGGAAVAADSDGWAEFSCDGGGVRVYGAV